MENNSNAVDITLCIDRSGSMNIMYEETISGVNKFIEEQKNTANETNIPTYITLKTFDNIAEIIPGFDNCHIKDVPNIDYNYLQPRGLTMLIDTAVNTLIEQNIRYTEWKLLKDNENKSMKRIFALLTDGDDNSSTLYSTKELNDIITKFQDDDVTCIFLGANQDAISQGKVYGFQEKYSMTYNQTKEGAENTFRSLSSQISSECKGELNDGFSELQRSASCPTPNTNNDYDDYDDFYELQRC
jgi:hypothetical protein